MSAVGFLAIAGGLVLVYAGLTGDNPVAAIQRALMPQTRGMSGVKAPTVTTPAPAGRYEGKPVPR